ncbi:MAG: ATP/GTP-binding protein [Candidatus Competibacterales bacterium]
MSQLKFLFTGPPGAGKTTAIAAISEFPPVSTDVATTDELAQVKATTTVAMDYGAITLEDGQQIGLYGTPGQRRFDFMWQVLAQGGLGLIVLINNNQTEPLALLDDYLDAFDAFIRETGVVIGVTATDLCATPSLKDYGDHLQRRGVNYPIFAVDVRRREDVLLLVDTLIAGLEA